MSVKIPKMMKELDLNSLKKYLNNTRRHLHSMPETAWLEYKTIDFIYNEIKDLGYEILTGDKIFDMSYAMGLPNKETNDLAYKEALLECSSESLKLFKDNRTALVAKMNLYKEKTVGIRFDIDALPIKESDDSSHFPFKKGFSSKTKGIMHSCGHDFHTAIGLALSKLISENKDKLHYNVILIFQPAEEGVRGAKAIVESGILDNVDILLAHHQWSVMPKGKIVCSQNGTLSTHKYDIEIFGKSAHAGICPEKGRNAILAASRTICALYDLQKQSSPSIKLNVGTIIGGQGRNIISDYTKFEMEVRAKDKNIEKEFANNVIEIINKTVKSYDCELKISIQGEAIGAVGNESIARTIYNLSQEISFFNNIQLSDEENRGSEDFTSMMNRVQERGGKACFIGIGAGIKGKELKHHSPNFDIDEESLLPSLLLFYKFLKSI